jgi:hypothetical protein
MKQHGVKSIWCDADAAALGRRQHADAVLYGGSCMSTAYYPPSRFGGCLLGYHAEMIVCAYAEYSITLCHLHVLHVNLSLSNVMGGGAFWVDEGCWTLL